MVAFNVTVEDSSPLITYSPPGAWADSDPNDALKSRYSGESIRTTRTRGAQATIIFNGTGISIFGFDKPNFGAFTVTVDGQTVDSGNAATTNSSPKKLLASIHGLKKGPHTVIVTNDDTSDINIDYMDVQHEGGLEGATVVTSMIDDTDPKIDYQPLNAWRTNNADVFMNRTLHFARTNGASVSLSFTGEAIAVYGTVSDDHANMRMSLNGQTTTLSAGSGVGGVGAATYLHPQVLLYFADGLGAGTHLISVISDIRDETAPFIDVDAFVVFSFDGGNSTGTGIGSNSGPQSSRSVPTKTIVGAAVGGGIALLVFIALAVFFILRKRRKRKNVPSPMTPVLPFQRTDMAESQRVFNFPPPVSKKSRFSMHSIAPSYYGASLLPSKPSRSRVISDSGSSATSSDVIKLGVPKPPSSNRSVSLASDSPIRPRPPPPLDLAT
ncbi:hypothetical protein Moror_6836 [Moniliophthora roreri MCA 2997]|uniref:Transmembrane protein n=1 Tax=Moniliophthora roreri (strain MCA 2997) TaxID=1381753 RepID=V2XUV7_MONRO|nr:hypothetical protein Moror_6836 [Moniliophthora roreri MCA 2997]